MIKITNWSAKRAGASITVTGIQAATGRVVKITGVKSIDVTRGLAIAGGVGVVAHCDDKELLLSVS